MKLHKHGKTHRRKYRGGASNPIAGAPLDYTSRPPFNPDGAGIYPPLVEKGFWNPQPAILQDSAQQKTVPYPSTGSNTMKGGAGLLSMLSSTMTASAFRPVAAQNPMTPQQSTMLSFKGLPTGPGANSYDNPGLIK